MQRLFHDGRVIVILYVWVDTVVWTQPPALLCSWFCSFSSSQAPTLGNMGDSRLKQQLLSNLMDLSTLSEGTVPSFSETVCMKLSLVCPARLEGDISSLSSDCALSLPSTSLQNYTQTPFVQLWESYLNSGFEEL